MPCQWLTPTARGIPTNGLETKHFHHKYDFWCETADGALQAKCSLEHGGKQPKSLGFASAFFPTRFLFEKCDHVYYLDIFENHRPLSPQKELSPDVLRAIFTKQHFNIDFAFLNFLSAEGKENFGWHEVPQA